MVAVSADLAVRKVVRLGLEMDMDTDTAPALEFTAGMERKRRKSRRERGLGGRA